MGMMRQPLCLIALILVIALDGCGLSSASQSAMLHPSSAKAAPLQDIFGNRGGTYLNLITCAGDWIPSQHQTTLRLVVYTAFE